MSDAELEPTSDQLLAMAYADGELSPAAAREFEARLSREPALVREVADHVRLDVLARHAAGPEPADYEWNRLRDEPLHSFGMRLGWSLFVAGLVSVAVWVLWSLESSALDPWIRLALGAALLGLAVLVALTLRARLRTLPYDPYRDIQR
jgi:anti-sigma factor RsiW